MPDSKTWRRHVLGACLAALMPVAGGAEAPVAIAIHGGAGTITRGSLTDEQEQRIRAELTAAAQAGHAVLSAGGSALDAVTAAVTALEDSPDFNAGRGAVFNAEGINELDAAIMDGTTARAGAVAAVQRIRNPILLARAVMEHSPHVLLVGTGAEAFAAERGLTFAGRDYFYTDRRWQQLQRAQGRDPSASARSDDHASRWYSTVGAVALDGEGRLAAATSTGGLTNKRYGRVGDVPVIGAGTYATTDCAVSATGQGEYFIRYAIAHDICSRARYTDLSVADAARRIILEELEAAGGTGGVITIDDDGRVELVFNTPGMYRATIGGNGKVEVGIYRDE